MARRGRQEAPSLADMLGKLADSIQPLSNLNYEPHEKQVVFHSSNMPEKVFIGGNRSGKTIASVNECIWRLTKTHPFRPELNEISGPVRGRLVCVSFVDGLEKIILPLFKNWMPVKYLKNMSWEDSYSPAKRTLTLNDGSFIEFMSYDQETEKFAGTSRHFCAFDEEPPFTVWQECKMRLLDTEGEWWIAMTPVEGMTWIFTDIYELWKEGKRPYTLVLEVNTDDNPHLTERGKEIAFGDMSDEDREMRKAGGFNEYRGLVYKDFREDLHVREPIIPHPRDRPQIYTSLDTGFRHPAVWLWHAVYPDGRVITFHEISRAEMTVENLAKLVHEYEKTVLRKAGWSQSDIIRVGDPNGMIQTKEHTGTSLITEYAMRGLYIGTNITRDVDLGIIRVTQYLQGRTSEGKGLWQVTSDCPQLIAGMKRYRWDMYGSKKMNHEKAPKPTPKKKDDDEVDSLRYFICLMPELQPGTVHVSKKLSNAAIKEIFDQVGGVTFEDDFLAHNKERAVDPIYSMEG